MPVDQAPKSYPIFFLIKIPSQKSKSEQYTRDGYSSICMMQTTLNPESFHDFILKIAGLETTPNFAYVIKRQTDLSFNSWGYFIHAQGIFKADALKKKRK